MNSMYRKYLEECKTINNFDPGVTQNKTANADKILYNHAISMVSDNVNYIIIYITITFHW